jgi:FkbM family methyltransferase
MTKEELNKWRVANNNDIREPLRITYPLTSTSIVYDLGGYKGEWAKHIYDKYKCRIHIFEPMELFYTNIIAKFKGCPTVSVHPYGLSTSDRTETFHAAKDGTSSHHSKGPKVEAKLKDISHFIETNNIDLIKLNIEGEEFPLLERMIELGAIPKFNNIQIQFHSWVPNADTRRHAIRKELSKTHELTYDYAFVWENWRRK